MAALVYLSGSVLCVLAEGMQFDPKFEPVVKQVFGRVVLCKSLDLAVTVARDMNCPAVTLDGDQVGGLLSFYVHV